MGSTNTSSWEVLFFNDDDKLIERSPSFQHVTRKAIKYALLLAKYFQTQTSHDFRSTLILHPPQPSLQTIPATMLNESGKLASVELAIYVVLIIPSLYVLWKHRWQGFLGYFFLVAFSLLREKIHESDHAGFHCSLILTSCAFLCWGTS